VPPLLIGGQDRGREPALPTGLATCTGEPQQWTTPRRPVIGAELGADGLPRCGLTCSPRRDRGRAASPPDRIWRQHENARNACDSAVGDRRLRQRPCPSFTLVGLAAPSPSPSPGPRCCPGLGGYLHPAPSGRRRNPNLDVVQLQDVPTSTGPQLVGVPWPTEREVPSALAAEPGRPDGIDDAGRYSTVAACSPPEPTPPPRRPRASRRRSPKESAIASSSSGKRWP
jgi:hypothetical protein